MTRTLTHAFSLVEFSDCIWKKVKAVSCNGISITIMVFGSVVYRNLVELKNGCVKKCEVNNCEKFHHKLQVDNFKKKEVEILTESQVLA